MFKKTFRLRDTRESVDHVKKIGLALGGGGARGLCHIEFIKAMDDLGLTASVVSGTSIGSIVGSFYAAGLSGKEIEDIANTVGLIELSKLIDLAILNPSGIVKGKGVEEFLKKYLPVYNFEDLKIPLKIVATDYWERKEVVFESGPLIQAIRASISIPGLFTPVKINKSVLVDGGAVNPLPYDLIRDQCDLLIAIDVSGKSSPPKFRVVPMMLESVINTYHIMETAMVENKLESLQPDIYVKPDLTNIQILDFYKHHFIKKSVQKDVAWFKNELERLAFDKSQERPKWWKKLFNKLSQ